MIRLLSVKGSKNNNKVTKRLTTYIMAFKEKGNNKVSDYPTSLNPKNQGLELNLGSDKQSGPGQELVLRPVSKRVRVHAVQTRGPKSQA